MFEQLNCLLLYNLLEACAVNMAEFNASSQITSCFENECLSSALFLKTGTVTQPCSLGRHIPYPTPTLLPLHSRDKVLEICQAASAVRKFKLCKYHAHILLVLHVIELNRKWVTTHTPPKHNIDMLVAAAQWHHHQLLMTSPSVAHDKGTW